MSTRWTNINQLFSGVMHAYGLLCKNKEMKSTLIYWVTNTNINVVYCKNIYSDKYSGHDTYSDINIAVGCSRPAALSPQINVQHLIEILKDKGHIAKGQKSYAEFSIQPKQRYIFYPSLGDVV